MSDIYTGKPYPAFQYSVFLKGDKDQQIVIRASNWEEFVESKKKVNEILEKVGGKEERKCEKCGAEMVHNPKTGKWFCKEKCWLKEGETPF